MSFTYLSDLKFVPETIKGYVDGAMFKNVAILGSEAVVYDSYVVPEAGSEVIMPSFNQFATGAYVRNNVIQDPRALSTSLEKAPILDRAQKWAVNDLVRNFTSADPLMNVVDKVGYFWAREYDEAVLASILGSAAGIDALDAGSVILDISGGVGAAAVIDAASIIDTQALGGEFMREYSVMVVHSDVLAVLRKQNLITTLQDRDSLRFFDFYGNARIVVSNTTGMKNVDGTYNTLLLARDAIRYAEGTPTRQLLEFDREISFGDIVGSARRLAISPRGAQWNVQAGVLTQAKPTASNADLLDADNWTLGAESALGYGVRVLKHKVA